MAVTAQANQANNANKAQVRHVAMFGGAFDPPHLAHRALAEAALAQLPLDLLHIVPTGQAWHKSRMLTDAVHRLAMCKLAFEGLAGAVLDEREIRRPGPSYTLDTLHELQAEYPQARLYLVMGQDQAEALPTWRNWQDIVALAMICVADRDLLTGRPAPFAPPPEMQGRHRHLQMPRMDISATDIREGLLASRGSGPAFAPLVSPAVARYIETHHLYQTA